MSRVGWRVRWISRLPQFSNATVLFYDSQRGHKLYSTSSWSSHCVYLELLSAPTMLIMGAKAMPMSILGGIVDPNAVENPSEVLFF